MRDLSRYRWKSDFHKAIWEKIKLAEPKFPNWTYEELQAHGYHIRHNPTTPRTYVDLVHTDGTFTSYKMMIDDQVMPHITAIILRIYGFDHRRFLRSEATAFKTHINAVAPEFVVTLTSTYFNINGNSQYIYKLFQQIQETPTDTTHPDVNITTAKWFVEEVCFMRQQRNVTAPASVVAG